MNMRDEKYFKNEGSIFMIYTFIQSIHFIYFFFTFNNMPVFKISFSASKSFPLK